MVTVTVAVVDVAAVYVDVVAVVVVVGVPAPRCQPINQSIDQSSKTAASPQQRAP